MKTLVIFISFMIPVFAQAATATDEVNKVAAAETSCLATASSDMDMKMCVGQADQDADKILNSMYSLAVNNMKKASDADSKETLRRLITAERAWITFRDANCSFAGTTMLGGTGESLEVGGCLADTTIERVKELDGILNGTN